MDPLTIASGLASFVGGALSAHSNEKTNEANLQIAREQNEFNAAMWQKNNAYNTPAMQAARYRAAGINPYFAMSNIQSGNAQAQTAAQTHPMQPTDYSFIGQSANNMLTTYMNMKQGKMLDEQIKAAQVDNQYREQQLLQSLRKTIAETDNFKLRNTSQQQLNTLMQETLQDQITIKHQERINSALETIRRGIENKNLSISGDILRYQHNVLNPKQAKLLDAQYQDALANVVATRIASYNQTRMTSQNIRESAMRVASSIQLQRHNANLFPIIVDKAKKDVSLLEQQLLSGAPAADKASRYMDLPEWWRIGVGFLSNHSDIINPFKFKFNLNSK